MKEASESEYWLELLKDEYIEAKYIEDLLKDLEEIMKLSIVTIKKRKSIEVENKGK